VVQGGSGGTLLWLGVLDLILPACLLALAVHFAVAMLA
jgi:hypothetical protein